MKTGSTALQPEGQSLLLQCGFIADQTSHHLDYNFTCNVRVGYRSGLLL